MSFENSVDNCEANLSGIPVATPEHDNNDLDNDGNFLDNALSSSNAYVTQILGEGCILSHSLFFNKTLIVEHHQISLSGVLGGTQVDVANVSLPIATQQLQSIDEHHQMSSSALSDETQVGDANVSSPIIIQPQAVDVNNVLKMFDDIMLASPTLIQHGYGDALARRWAAVGNTLNCFNCDLSHYMALLSTSSRPNTPSPFLTQSTSSIFTNDSSITASGSLMSTLTPLSSRCVSVNQIMPKESAATSAPSCSFGNTTKSSRSKSLQTIQHSQPQNDQHVIPISDDEEGQPQKRKRGIYASWSFKLVKDLVDAYKATDTNLKKSERIKAVQQSLDPTHPLVNMSPKNIRCKLESLKEL